jgi:NADP-dependent 3-hydroxy acid dehydrogenase YdfG
MNQSSTMTDKSIIITGVTSGIGHELARLFIEKGYKTGGTGRRIERLEAMKRKFGDRFFYRQMDVTNSAMRGIPFCNWQKKWAE